MHRHLLVARAHRSVEVVVAEVDGAEARGERVEQLLGELLDLGRASASALSVSHVD
jgi:hypothetical protein